MRRVIVITVWIWVNLALLAGAWVVFHDLTTTSPEERREAAVDRRRERAAEVKRREADAVRRRKQELKRNGCRQISPEEVDCTGK